MKITSNKIIAGGYFDSRGGLTIKAFRGSDFEIPLKPYKKESKNLNIFGRLRQKIKMIWLVITTKKVEVIALKKSQITSCNSALSLSEREIITTSKLRHIYRANKTKKFFELQNLEKLN